MHTQAGPPFIPLTSARERTEAAFARDSCRSLSCSFSVLRAFPEGTGLRFLQEGQSLRSPQGLSQPHHPSLCPPGRGSSPPTPSPHPFPAPGPQDLGLRPLFLQPGDQPLTLPAPLGLESDLSILLLEKGFHLAAAEFS